MEYFGMANHDETTNVGTSAGMGKKQAYARPSLKTYGSIKELTGTLSGTTTGDSSSKMMTTSDPQVKENVVRVGEHPAGFGLYLFDYKAEFAGFGAGRQFGVMADEVAQIVPEAVVRGDHGFLTVNYDMLGITRH